MRGQVGILAGTPEHRARKELCNYPSGKDSPNPFGLTAIDRWIKDSRFASKSSVEAPASKGVLAQMRDSLDLSDDPKKDFF